MYYTPILLVVNRPNVHPCWTENLALRIPQGRICDSVSGLYNLSDFVVVFFLVCQHILNWLMEVWVKRIPYFCFNRSHTVFSKCFQNLLMDILHANAPIFIYLLPCLFVGKSHIVRIKRWQ